MTSSRRPGLERKSETRLLPWFSLTPNQPTVLFSSSPLYHCSQFHGLSPLLQNFISQYILFPMLVRTWGARRLCPPVPLGKTSSTNSTLTPSPTFSLKTDWFHFPWHCPFSSTVSCYLSCLGYLCHFPVAVQGSTCLLSSSTLMGTHSLSCCCQVPADLTLKDLPLPLWVMVQGTPSQRKSFSCGFPSASFALLPFNVLQGRIGVC